MVPHRRLHPPHANAQDIWRGRTPGRKIHWGVEVNEIVVSKGKVTGLATSRGHISAGRCCERSGSVAWYTEPRLASGELPGRSTEATSGREHADGHSARADADDDLCGYRISPPRARRSVLLLWPNQPAPDDPFDTKVEDDWLPASVRCRKRSRPFPARLVIDRDSCYAGLYEMSPDNHAILGPSPSARKSLFFANGSSGPRRDARAGPRPAPRGDYLRRCCIKPRRECVGDRRALSRTRSTRDPRFSRHSQF